MIKVGVAVLLLLCLTDLPYSFREIVRFASAAAFGYLSYDYFRLKREGLGFLFAALALLFQPFFKVALGRTIWNLVDILVVIGLVYLILNAFSKKKRK